jgi:hypothetical protein
LGPKAGIRRELADFGVSFSGTTAKPPELMQKISLSDRYPNIHENPMDFNSRLRGFLSNVRPV